MQLDLSAAGKTTPAKTSPLTAATRQLAEELGRITPPAPITVYSPLDYGWRAHERYLGIAASGPRPVLFVGMNPGPWGMVQTALPFGDVSNAGGVQTIAGPWRPDDLIDVPAAARAATAHLRPIQGYLCRRQEVSGSRFWGEFAPIFGSVDELLERAFILNVCPLAFFGPANPTKGPRSPAENVTPDKLPRPYRDDILAPCRTYFHTVARTLQPRGIVCFGGWAFKMVSAWVQSAGVLEVAPRVEQVQHPSPRVLAMAEGWRPAAALRERGFWRACDIE